MKRKLLDTFVLPHLALVEAAAQPTESQGEASSWSLLAQARLQAELPGADQAHQEVVRADALSADGVHCLLLGAAGSGKTALLRYLAYDKAQNKDYFPIFLSLRTLRYDASEYWKNLILLAFRESTAQMRNLHSKDIQDLGHHVARSAAQGRVALFLDGLDEMDLEARDSLCRLVTDFLSSSMSQNSLVLSTRPDASLASRLKGLTRYEILPLNLQQTRSLIEKHLPDPVMAAELMHQFVAVPALRALAKIPYLVVLFAKSVSRVTGSSLLTANPLRWYEHAAEQILGDTPDTSGALRTLELMAYQSVIGDAPTEPRRGFTVQSVKGAAQSWVKDKRRAADLATAVLASPIVTRTGEGVFEFAHRSLEEYLAACAVSRLPQPLELIRRKVFDSAISDQEVLPIAVGLLPHPKRAYQLLEALPESVDFSVLRIRARTLRYAERLRPHHAERLANDLEKIIVDAEVCFADTLARVAADLAGIIDEFAAAIVGHAAALLQSPDATVRQRAALALGSMRSPRAIESLGRAMHDSKVEVQEEAAKALGNIGDPGCVPLLQHAYLHNERSMVFDAAVKALVKIGGPQTVSALITILNDTTIFKNLRWPVARSLGEIGDPSAYGALAGALSDEAESVREHAARALGALGDLRAGPALRPLLADAEVGVRHAAAEALGRLRDREATADLLKALRDSHPMVRESAAEALMQTDRVSLAQALGEIIRDQGASWRGEAANWLAKVTGKEALPLLLLLIKDADAEVREGAASGLMNLAEEEAAKGLLSLTDDPSPDVRRRAADALGHRQYRPAVPALVRRLESEDSDLVCIELASALGKIGDRQAVGPLSRMLEKSGAIPYYSALALGMIGDEKAIPALVAMCKRTRGNEFLRDWPMRAKARIGGPTATQSLTEMLQTEDLAGRRLLVNAISELDDPAAVFCLLLGVSDEDRLVRMSALDGLRALPRQTLEAGLRQGLAHTDPRVRRETARLIPFYADEATYKKLRDIALTDTDPQVMWAAAEALKACRAKRRPLSEPTRLTTASGGRHRERHS